MERTEQGDAPDLMTTAEIAEYLRTPRGTLAHWRHAGKGPRGFKLGKRILYKRTDVEAFLEAAQLSGAAS